MPAPSPGACGAYTGRTRLYLASASSCEVLVRGGDPVHGTGTDRRVPADP